MYIAGSSVQNDGTQPVYGMPPGAHEDRYVQRVSQKDRAAFVLVCLFVFILTLMLTLMLGCTAADVSAGSTITGNVAPSETQQAQGGQDEQPQKEQSTEENSGGFVAEDTSTVTVDIREEGSEQS